MGILEPSDKADKPASKPDQPKLADRFNAAPEDTPRSSVGLNFARETARAYGLRCVCALDGDAPDPSLYQPAHLAYYHQHHYLPYMHKDGQLVLVTSHYSSELFLFASTIYGDNIRFVTASKRDVNSWLAKRAATQHTREAKHKLRRHYKHLSADRTLIKQQIIPLIAPLILLTAALFAAPAITAIVIIALCNIFYIATLLFKMLVYKQWQKIYHKADTEKSAPTASNITLLSDDALPVYTLLIPVYAEPESVLKRLLESIDKLDYPAEKKDVLLICEADDSATINSLKALHPPEYCSIIMIPPSHPRTKPKALNIALSYAKGQYAVIYDAEDQPHPMQLKLAASRFASEDDLACLQAPLNYYNRNENLLTQLFAIEYGTLFRMQLPALERLGLPIPLGGTSNHIRMDVLQQAKGWDAFNVTEDADLGVRLSYLGKRISLLDSITLEEAPITLRSWFKQRSRWIKGYMQTWLVYMRNPKQLKNKLGDKAYYGFQFFVGAPALTFLLAPFFWIVFLGSHLGIIGFKIPFWLNLSCISCLIFGIYSQWLYAKSCLILHGWKGLKIAASIYPFYWFLHIVASFMALYDLVLRPHHWRKTSHGLSKITHKAT
jgi:cellulose synthase/poly-beta-1,6-N-acetylglucosamine synthase-like glycosyltransferase